MQYFDVGESMNKNQRNVISSSELAALGIELFGMYRNYQPESVLVEHSHDSSVEICYLERGSQVYSVGGQDYELTGGDVFITFPGEPHSSRETRQLRGCLYWIILNMSCPNFLGLSADDSELLQNCISSITTRHFGITKQTAGLLIQAFHGLFCGSELTKIIARSQLVLFIYGIASEALNAVAPCELSREITHCIEYIDAHIKGNISVAELAAVVNFSESHFKSKFKREVGSPPGDYITARKIQASIDSLKSHTITETAYEYGFCSSQHYTQAFRSVFGMAPSEYKKKI